MANLKAIKNRIKSVTSTGKITQAMKMVAAVKIKKAETAAKQSRPYTEFLMKIFAQLQKTGADINYSEGQFVKALENYPALLKKRPIKNVALLVLTADKGLAGAFNTNIIKETNKTIQKLKEENIGVKLFIVGLKGISSLKKTYYEDKDVEVVKNYSKIPPMVEVEVANMIAEDIAKFFVEEKVDAIDVIFTKFKTRLSNKVVNAKLLPLQLPDDKHIEEINSEMLFEPTKSAVLKKLVPLYISNTIYSTLKESMASELSARTNAMSNASKNAEEIAKNLSKEYNKIRQYTITQEITEVISGSLSKK